MKTFDEFMDEVIEYTTKNPKERELSNKIIFSEPLYLLTVKVLSEVMALFSLFEKIGKYEKAKQVYEMIIPLEVQFSGLVEEVTGDLRTMFDEEEAFQNIDIEDLEFHFGE